jgi:hypothetical protein
MESTAVETTRPTCVEGREDLTIRTVRGVGYQLLDPRRRPCAHG